MALEKGTTVNFVRDFLIKENATTIAYNEIPQVSDGNSMEPYRQRTVIIESPNFGWQAREPRKTIFNLDPTKKYLFVKESELTEF